MVIELGVGRALGVLLLELVEVHGEADEADDKVARIRRSDRDVGNWCSRLESSGEIEPRPPNCGQELEEESE